MNRQWRLISTVIVVGAYLIPGLIAANWWMSLGNDASMLGVSPRALIQRAPNLTPILIATICSIPGALVCYSNRSKLIHLLMIALPAVGVYAAVWFYFHGAYFGCDRNGCGAEESFLLNNVFEVLCSVAGVLLLQTLLLIFEMGSERLHVLVVSRRLSRDSDTKS